MPVLVLAGLLAGGSVAGAQQSAPPVPVPLDLLSGRYQAQKSGQMFDISRCGSDFCAIRITPAGGCGDVAMRLVAEVGTAGFVSVSGRFDHQPGLLRHAVVGRLLHDRADSRRIVLSLHGEPGDTLRYFRRIFPYAETLARQGEGACRLEDATS